MTAQVLLKVLSLATFMTNVVPYEYTNFQGFDEQKLKENKIFSYQGQIL